MQLQYHTSKTDYRRARAVVQPQLYQWPWWKLLLYGVAVLGPTVILIATAAMAAQGWVWVCPLAWVVLLGVAAANVFTVRREARDMTLTTEAEGLRFGDDLLEWGVFDALIETDDFFILPHTGREHEWRVIPKRAFASPGDITTFRRLLRSKIGV